MTAQARLIIVVLLALMLLSGIWLWRRLAATPPPPMLGRPSATLTPTAEATPTPLAAPPGYRLAGVAVGEPDSFVVVESPNGAHTLYRVNAEVPGLGRVVRIDAEHVVVESPEGQFEMWLAPAPTDTPTPIRTVVRTSARTPGTPTVRRVPRAPAAGIAPRSRP